MPIFKQTQCKMKAIWITYSWEDNKNGDVEFIAQEIEKSGMNVKLDRWNLQAGKRLWEQIDKFITNPAECDAWAIIATQNSLGSEPCKEEISYALARALDTRGKAFPLIGIFNTSIDKELIPSAIKARLYVSLQDKDWIERIKSTLEDRIPNISRPPLEPYTIEFRKTAIGTFAVEIRPKAGIWAPFFCAIPISETDNVKPHILRGPIGSIPMAGIRTNCGDIVSDDKNWWIMFAGDEATPILSYYLFCNELPSKIAFGVHNSQPQFLFSVY
jgi:hypothetical protein